MSLRQEITWLLQEKYHGVENAAFQTDLIALQNGVPLAYLIGHTPFLDTVIDLTSHPLIPRPETEYWTEQFITQVKSQNPQEWNSGQGLHLLDLGAGSGAIGVAVARALPEARVDFVEIEPVHKDTIQKNLNTNLPDLTIRELKERYRVFISDLFTAMPKGCVYDYILSNPPYIDREANTVDYNVEIYEPARALFGGEKGLETIARIIAKAPFYLKTGGELWLEHEPFQSGTIKILGTERGLLVETRQDQYQVERFSILSKL